MNRQISVVFLGSDHAGFALKKKLEQHLQNQGWSVSDQGTHSEESTDYPDWADAVAKAVAEDSSSRGILVCGSGIGVCMAANKTPGIRAARVSEPYSAELARRHNDARIVCMGARLIGSDMAVAIAETFLATSFEGGRHEKRVQKINALEKK
jgi:ribose 5-phosphate isomerase B